MQKSCLLKSSSRNLYDHAVVCCTSTPRDGAKSNVKIKSLSVNLITNVVTVVFILSQVFRIKQKARYVPFLLMFLGKCLLSFQQMVRLKRCSEMSVLKNISMRMEGLPETEVWVALMKTAVSFNSLNSFYDGFYYKNDIGINNISRNQLSLRVSGGRNVLLKFGSPGTMEEFCKNIK